ncbi:MAG: hypothetical protein N2559_09095 [Anaerolineae bacterium]|nr:hypothetical protein [Anaerolineae bacterium]
MSNANSIRLSYRLLRGQRMPIVRVGLFRDSRRTEDMALVDSGAVYSIFDASIAERLGIDLKLGRRVLVWGLGGNLVVVYLHPVGLMLDTFHITAEVGFSDQLRIGFNLLGRHSIFNQLQFCFNDRDGHLIVTRL